MPGTDPDTFLNRIRRFLIDLLKRESRTGAVRAQTMTLIRLKKDDELVELAFNSRMTKVYRLSCLDEIVGEMIKHMKEQLKNPAILNSRFIFDEVLFTNVDFHQLNLTRGSITKLAGSQESHNKSKKRRSRMLQMGCNRGFEVRSDQ